MSRLMTKPTKWQVLSAMTNISLGIHPVWSESSLSAWRKLGSLATRWAHSEDSEQTGRMSRLIWVFAGCTVILLVLSWGGSNNHFERITWITCCLTISEVLSSCGLTFVFRESFLECICLYNTGHCTSRPNSWSSSRLSSTEILW